MHESPTAASSYPLSPGASCSLIGPTALLVQFLMGVLVISSLVLKRHRERPKRPWRIFVFDVSKQVVGQACVHLANVVISWIGSSREEGNACAWYLVNIVVDTTLGVLLIYFALKGVTQLLIMYLNVQGIVSGEYGKPPKWSYFFRQLWIYLACLAIMKAIVLGLFALVPQVENIAEWALRWTEDNWALQVVLVMGVIPILMNILQFWLIDSIVKSKVLNFPSAPTPVPEDATDRDPLMPVSEESGVDEEDDTRFASAENGGRRFVDDIEAQKGTSLDRNPVPKEDTKLPLPASAAESAPPVSTTRKPPFDRGSSESGSIRMARLGSRALSPPTSNHPPAEHPPRTSLGSEPNWDWNESTEWSSDDRQDRVDDQGNAVDVSAQS